ncbi:hypothetical protein RHAA1_02214 [Aggregatibacter actinomycetemcomitans RhAA1]|nr:hypothetical protein RHAA1_02214 [Aggregatibacter actinomycetemcomitans RhAA1]
MQLKFIGDDVRFVNYSTLHPRHDMTFLLNEVHMVSESKNKNTLICGVGFGGYWAKRIGFLCGIKQAIFNRIPDFDPEIENSAAVAGWRHLRPADPLPACV